MVDPVPQDVYVAVPDAGRELHGRDDFYGRPARGVHCFGNTVDSVVIGEGYRRALGKDGKRDDLRRREDAIRCGGVDVQVRGSHAAYG